MQAKLNAFLAVLMCGPVRANAGENVTKIVAAGGRRYDGGSLNTVEIYDISLDTWSTGISNFAIVTFFLVVILIQTVKDHEPVMNLFRLGGEALDDLFNTEIKKVELSTTNYNSYDDKLHHNVKGGTIILTAKDGSKGVISDQSFTMLDVSLDSF